MHLEAALRVGHGKAQNPLIGKDGLVVEEVLLKPSIPVEYPSAAMIVPIPAWNLSPMVRYPGIEGVDTDRAYSLQALELIAWEADVPADSWEPYEEPHPKQVIEQCRIELCQAVAGSRERAPLTALDASNQLTWALLYRDDREWFYRFLAAHPQVDAGDWAPARAEHAESR